ncbi:MAG TPA: hypothetical protein VFD65_05445 [Chitinophagales bacterium]|nr:hypothetical protein [Chitinophagales bacterium]
MKHLLFFNLLLLLSCNRVEMPEFVTDDPELLEEYSNKALEEAQLLLDSLEQTPILNPEI